MCSCYRQISGQPGTGREEMVATVTGPEEAADFRLVSVQLAKVGNHH